MSDDEITSQYPTPVLVVRIIDSIAFFFLSVAVSLMLYRKQFSLRGNHVHLVFCLFFTLWVLFLIYVIGDFHSSTFFCWFFSVSSQLLLNASFLWELCIAISLFRVSVLSLPAPSPFSLLLHHWIVWSASLFFTSLPATTGDLGPPECWINESTASGRVWSLLALHLPLLCYLFVILVLYAVAIFRLRTVKRIEAHPTTGRVVSSMHHKKIIYFMALYPVVFFCCWIPAIAYRFQILSTRHHNVPFGIVANVGAVLHPILSVLIYTWPTLVVLYHKIRNFCL